jgi:dTMP kinase
LEKANIKGKLIVLEGLDKAGKTTQAKLLFEFYNKMYPGCVSLFNFPDYSTRIGQTIKLFLDGKIQYNNEVKHILLSANRWEKKSELVKLKNHGNTVILNRYYQSNLVYGLSNDIDLNWLINLDIGLPKEDLVIVLDIDPSISYKRSIENNFRLDEFEKNKVFLDKARKNYLDLAKRFNWVVINSDSDPKRIFQLIVKAIENT